MKQAKTKKPKSFADYKGDARNWITLASGEYDPDILKDACELYKPVLVLFGQLLKSSESSTRLFLQIAEHSDGPMRVQLARVFRKYVSPETPVEMLKMKSRAKTICSEFGKGFRPIQKVQAAFTTRPLPDEALCAVLWEYKDRGKKGYDLTERFFLLFRSTFPDLHIKGPERAGKDVLLGTVFENYPKPDRPVDFVICDASEKEILEVFGRSNFRNWITRKKCNPKNYTRKTYGNIADYILFYTRSENYVWHRPLESWTEERANKEYQYVEAGTGRRYKKVPVHAPGVRNGETGQLWRGMKPPPGKHWQYPPRVLDEMDTRGEIYWSPTGNPRRKIYLDESNGVAVQDIWFDCRDAHNQNIAISGYPTEKNPNLLSRIIQSSSNDGDIVLDCFSGSGTTLSVASHLGRRWVGVDNSREAVAATLRRFGKGLELMGDFVSMAKTSRKDDEPALELPLFGANEFDQPPAKTLPPHQTIKDFTLFAQEPYNGQLHDLIQLWREWIGESKSLQLSEISPAYKTQRTKKTSPRKLTTSEAPNYPTGHSPNRRYGPGH